MLVGRNKFPPGNDANYRKIDRNVDEGNRDHTCDDRAGDGATGITHLLADVADVVVTEVVKDRNASGGPEAKQKADGEIKCARRKIKGQS